MQGLRPLMTGHRITRPKNLPCSFSIHQATTSSVDMPCIISSVGIPCIIVDSVEVCDFGFYDELTFRWQKDSVPGAEVPNGRSPKPEPFLEEVRCAS
jgi:hypothetical protein